MEPTPDPHAKSLIVGANGQVGAALVAALGAHALPAGRALNAEIHLLADLAAFAANPTLAHETLAPLALDAVFCVAGATDVERCESDPAWAAAINHTGPAALARAARHLPFIFFSTDYVFDGSVAHPGPYVESSPTNPLSAYGRTKFAGEQAILDSHPNALILRTTGVFGPDRQRKNFLYTLTRLLSSGQTMRVPTDQISNPTYNLDLATAALALVARGVTGIVHIGGPVLLSRFDFATRAARILSLDTANLIPVTTAELNQRAPRPLLSGLANGKLTATLGYNPMRPIDQAIADWRDQALAAQPA